MKQFDKIILNVPHSSIENWHEGWDKPLELYPYVKQLTDWYTDLLFANPSCTMVRFPYSRFYCDAERLKDDPLEKKGQGIAYTSYADCKREGDLSWVLPLWEAHQEALSSEIKSDDTLIIDCHSFPSRVSNVIDVCIGYNDDWSKPSDDVIDFICKAFVKEGLNIGINKPYSNSITPQSDFKYKSIMIEINKRIYMNEGTISPNKEGFERLNAVLGDIYKQLLK